MFLEGMLVWFNGFDVDNTVLGSVVDNLDDRVSDETKVDDVSMGTNVRLPLLECPNNPLCSEELRATKRVKEKIVVNGKDVTFNLSRPFPEVRFSAHVHEQIDHSMRKTVVIKMLGHSIGFQTLANRIEILWNLQGFSFSYYSNAMIRRIGSVIGKAIKVGYNTLASERGKFARLIVLMDLNKPLVTCVKVDGGGAEVNTRLIGVVQKLEYEGLHNICFACGIYDHEQAVCGKGKDIPEKHQHDSLVSMSDSMQNY
ncbi:hypothetical protein V6N12_016825 [Hibiscus sabdariffa]|uniref:DUF4283 domain-containing protein n=1 Tax=Hibiscus sabdariffa TaxID=183260 RepID=A0ABR2BP88_9ROSI